MAEWKLDWQGDEVFRLIVEAGKSALVKYGLMVEGDAKRELYPGHGVITSTLRRSIHSAPADYNWSGDDVEPSPGSPERGNQKFEPSVEGTVIAIAVGSGLTYALPVHQGHHSFGGYHYITNAHEKNSEKFLPLFQDEVKGQGIQ